MCRNRSKNIEQRKKKNTTYTVHSQIVLLRLFMHTVKHFLSLAFAFFELLPDAFWDEALDVWEVRLHDELNVLRLAGRGRVAGHAHRAALHLRVRGGPSAGARVLVLRGRRESGPECAQRPIRAARYAEHVGHFRHPIRGPTHAGRQRGAARVVAERRLQRAQLGHVRATRTRHRLLLLLDEGPLQRVRVGIAAVAPFAATSASSIRLQLWCSGRGTCF